MAERDADEDALDETIEESFPASDAPANTVETGILAHDPLETAGVAERRDARRLELTADGAIAFLEYGIDDGALVVVHTEVPPHLRGRHLGETLVTAAVRKAREEGLRLTVLCPFARVFLRRHPEVLRR